MKFRLPWINRGCDEGQDRRTERRPIEIPPEIKADDLAIARHVVSTPDVVLWSIAVVTDDLELSSTGPERNVVVISNRRLLDLLRA